MVFPWPPKYIFKKFGGSKTSKKLRWKKSGAPKIKKNWGKNVGGPYLQKNWANYLKKLFIKLGALSTCLLCLLVLRGPLHGPFLRVHPLMGGFP